MKEARMNPGVVILSIGATRRKLLNNCLQSLVRSNPDLPYKVITEPAHLSGFRSRQLKTVRSLPVDR
jgi:hypothetical protein